MHTVLFDIDGTLLDAAGAGQQAMAATMLRLFGEPLRAESIPCAGRTDRAIMHDFLGLHGVHADRGDACHRFAEYCAAFVETLADYLPRYPGRVLPGVLELLEQLRLDTTIQIGLLTGNLRRAARLKLQHYALDHYFYAAHDAVGGFGDDHHDRNDVARAALEAVAAHRGTDVAAEHVWIVGDTPNDVRCARAVGARVVAVATGQYAYDELAKTEPDLLFRDLTECQPWLEGLGGAAKTE